MDIQTINWNEVEEKATNYLSRYIQVNTTNPPGNETKGALFLKDIFDQEGIENEIVESGPGRGSLIALLKSTGSKPPLLLLSHIDVVPAEEEKWTYPPFSGKIVGEEIWGRGALDCKSLGIMETMVLILLKKLNLPLKRDVVLAATADEEKGGQSGVAWLCKNRPEFNQFEVVINEGGGLGLARKTKNFYLCQAGEKGACWIRIIFKGTPGHASLPREDNCILALGRSIEALEKYRARIQVTPIAEKFIQGFSDDEEIAPILQRFLMEPVRAEEILEALPDQGLKKLLLAMLHTTFVPTVVKGGEKVNVIPSECFCEVDCRILPGETIEGFKKEIAKILEGIPQYIIEEIQCSTASESDFSHEIVKIFGEALLRHDPKAVVVPFISSGATDSRFFRKGKTVAFGFAPQLVEGDAAHHQDMVHGHNERIAKKDLLFGTKVLFDIVRSYCA
jgi:acetylornithine deacetylase/succinyl-diaminopimelate desuccinylase-like protein